MDRPQRYSTIIVALDGTRRTESILGPARDFAKIYGATLVLVRVQSRDTLPAEDDPASGPSVALAAGPAVDNVSGIGIPTAGARAGDSLTPAQPIEDQDALGYLNVLNHELAEAGLTVEHVDPDGDPADALVNEARSRGASLIVLGTHQRSGWERLFRGGTAEKVLRASPCPVLVVPLDVE